MTISAVSGSVASAQHPRSNHAASSAAPELTTNATISMRLSSPKRCSRASCARSWAWRPLSTKVTAKAGSNFASSAFNQGNATATAGFAHSFANRDTLSLSGQAQQFWLGTNSYRQAYGAIGQYTHLLAGGRALSYSAQFFRLHYDNQPLLNANRYALGASYADRKFVVSGSGGLEKTLQAAGNAQSNYFADGSVSTELALTKKLAFVGGIGFDLRGYDERDVLFLVKRHDTRIDASAGLKLLVSQHISLRPRATYTRNFSNIAIYDFERFTASLGLRFEF